MIFFISFFSISAFSCFIRAIDLWTYLTKWCKIAWKMITWTSSRWMILQEET